MPFTTKTRYGSMKSYTDDGDIPRVVEALIRELETEIFSKPDDEHYQVAVGHGDWAVTVTVYGLMILDDMSGDDAGKFAPELFRRASSREEAVQVLTLMAQGKIEEVRDAGWVPREELPEYRKALFRKEKKPRPKKKRSRQRD